MTTPSSTQVNPRADRRVELAIPLWIVGERRGPDRERRKDPGALARRAIAPLFPDTARVDIVAAGLHSGGRATSTSFVGAVMSSP